MRNLVPTLQRLVDFAKFSRQFWAQVAADKGMAVRREK